MTLAAGLAIALFVCLALSLLLGLPVAFTLAGVSLIFAGIGILTGSFDASFLEAFPNRVFGIMGNETLLAVPLMPVSSKPFRTACSASWATRPCWRCP